MHTHEQNDDKHSDEPIGEDNTESHANGDS